MTTPRVPSGSFRDIGPINWALSKAISIGAGTKEAHLFSTLGHAGGLFRTWLLYSGNLLAMGNLPRAETELVVLRVAHLRNCSYEWAHHVRLGRKSGLTAADIERVKAGPDADWSPRRRALLSAVDEIVVTKSVSNQTWDAVLKHYSRDLQVEITLLTTQYDALATVINTLGVEDDFEG